MVNQVEIHPFSTKNNIINYCKDNNIKVLVDEAHGAHLHFSKYFPVSAVELGADIVIQSFHKTLPSMTQTAVLHICSDMADVEKIKRFMGIYQTSSPSYILMAGIDQCMEMLDHHCEEVFDLYVERLKRCREELGKCEHIRLAETEHYDKSKLVLSVAGLTKGLADTYGAEATGIQLQEDLLNQYHLQMEMAAGTYVIAMTSIGDTKEGMDRLLSALFEIDEELEKKSEEEKRYYLPRQEQVFTSFEVEGMRRMETVRSMSWQESAGFISMEYAYLYPPGIPLIVPGERITKETAAMLVDYQNKGFSVEGMNVENYIEVLINE